MGEALHKKMSVAQKVKAKKESLSFRIRQTINNFIVEQWNNWMKVVLVVLLIQIIAITSLINFHYLKKTEKISIANAQVDDEVASAVAYATIEQSEPQNSTSGEDTSSASSQNIALIKKIAKEENFENVDGLLRLAMCESSLGRKDINVNFDKLKTTDRGMWMINDYWHAEVTDEQAYDKDWSTRWTIKRIKQGYLHEWMCSHVYNNVNYKIQ